MHRARRGPSFLNRFLLIWCLRDFHYHILLLKTESSEVVRMGVLILCLHCSMDNYYPMVPSTKKISIFCLSGRLLIYTLFNQRIASLGELTFGQKWVLR